MDVCPICGSFYITKHYNMEQCDDCNYTLTNSTDDEDNSDWSEEDEQCNTKGTLKFPYYCTMMLLHVVALKYKAVYYRFTANRG